MIELQWACVGENKFIAEYFYPGGAIDINLGFTSIDQTDFIRPHCFEIVRQTERRILNISIDGRSDEFITDGISLQREILTTDRVLTVSESVYQSFYKTPVYPGSLIRFYSWDIFGSDFFDNWRNVYGGLHSIGIEIDLTKKGKTFIATADFSDATDNFNSYGFWTNMLHFFNAGNPNPALPNHISWIRKITLSSPAGCDVKIAQAGVYSARINNPGPPPYWTLSAIKHYGITKDIDNYGGGAITTSDSYLCFGLDPFVTGISTGVFFQEYQLQPSKVITINFDPPIMCGFGIGFVLDPTYGWINLDAFTIWVDTAGAGTQSDLKVVLEFDELPLIL